MSSRANGSGETLLERMRGLPDSAAAVRRARKGGRKVTSAFLERVAEVYRNNVGNKPTEAVAVAFGIKHSTAAEYVRRARAAPHHYLPPTTRGKANG